ncbi:MAG: fibronectin type III domain-containing protein [Chloroflexi bacterium]|nr:fibronectin type III domain-containing protein [Chloroflexota bacterium]
MAIYTSASSRPNTLVGTLTAPASVVSGVNTFTAVGGIDLDASTTYFVVIDATGTADNYQWFGIGNAFAQTGGAAGWSISNESLDRSSGAWGVTRVFGGQEFIPRLAIHGYVKDARPPDAPGAPTLAGVTGRGGELKVSWDAPSNTNGAGVIDYDLRYCGEATDAACAGKWIAEGDGATSGLPDPGATPGSTTAVTISGLAAGSTYRVQVRAQNAAGESAWSATGTGTTAAATTSGNAAPVVLKVVAVDPMTNLRCAVDTASTPSTGNQSSPAGIPISVARPLTITPTATEFPTSCFAASVSRPWFHDTDGDTLSLTLSVTLPANVRSVHNPGDVPYPLLQPVSGGGYKLSNRAVAAGADTDVVATVTATDPHGASKSLTRTFNVSSFVGSAGAPSLPAPGLLRFAQNTRGSAALPAATGGDRPQYGYLYHVSGLPPELEFDPETRTVSGTPTSAGTWTATYTADDFDGHYSRKESATAADKADAAVRTFTVRVEAATGAAPAIEGVQIVGAPAHESVANSNVYDTYIQGDEILIDVQFNRPVAVNLPKSNSVVRLRIDLGADDTTLTNSRKTADLKSVEAGGHRLRFAYEVQAADTDADGVWVQTAGTNKQVVFLAHDAAVVDAETGVAADRDFPAGLPTSGASRRKVDGSVSTASGIRVHSAEVDGAALTVVFDTILLGTSNVDTALLATNLAVQGAGDVQGELIAYQHPDKISFGTGTYSDEGTVRTLTEMRLTLTQPARPGQRVTLDYLGGNQLRRASKHVAPFGKLEVTNKTGGAAAVAPAPLRGSVAGSVMTVEFTRALNETSLPPASAFRVRLADPNNDGRWLFGVGATSVSGAKVTVPLNGAARADERVRVSYVKPTSGAVLKDKLLHSEAASFRDFPLGVTHDLAPPGPPSMVVVQHPTNDQRSHVTLYFGEALDTGSVPAAANFTARRGGSAGLVVASGSHAVTNNAVTFQTLASSTADTTVWHLAYDPDATGGTPIRDADGNAVAAFTVQATAASDDKPVPTSSSIAVDGTALKIIFSAGSLDPAGIPAASAFTFREVADSNPAELDIGIADISVNGIQLLLRLKSPVPPCAGATSSNVPFRITYTKPAAAGAAKLRSIANTADVDSFGGTTGWNVRNDRSWRCQPVSQAGE